MTTIAPGYIGYLQSSLHGHKIRVSSFSVNPEQSVSFYDHTIGIRDSIPASIYEGKKQIDWLPNRMQKNIYRPGVISVSGSFDFPYDDKTKFYFFDEAHKAVDFDLTFFRSCHPTEGILATKYYGCRITSYQLNASASDTIKCNVGIMAINAEEYSGGSAPDHTIRKLVTWDKSSITAQDLDDENISSFSLTIENPCSYVYTAGMNKDRGLKPAKIRSGIQSINGTISLYNKGKSLDYIPLSGTKLLKIKIDSIEKNIRCIYRPIARTPSIGAVVSTLAFTGVGSGVEI